MVATSSSHSSSLQWWASPFNFYSKSIIDPLFNQDVFHDSPALGCLNDHVVLHDLS